MRSSPTRHLPTRSSTGLFTTATASRSRAIPCESRNTRSRNSHRAPKLVDGKCRLIDSDDSPLQPARHVPERWPDINRNAGPTSSEYAGTVSVIEGRRNLDVQRSTVMRNMLLALIIAFTLIMGLLDAAPPE